MVFKMHVQNQIDGQGHERKSAKKTGTDRALISTIQERQKVFFGHVMWKDGLERLAILGKVPGKRGRGRPRRRFRRHTRSAVYLAKKKAEKEVFADIEKGADTIYWVAKQLHHENQDVVGEKCVFDGNGNMAFNEDAKKIA